MKKILATLLLFMSIIGYSQTNGITYQAVIMNPSGEQLPGVNNTNAPLANKNICLKFSIIDNNSQYEYVETVQTTTDEFGMVNLIIGTGVQIGGFASSFANILWNANPKSLKVDLSTTGICSYYTEISNQPFTAVPFALYAVNSESAAALAALQATVITNATATTAALALKEDAANKSTTTTLGTSNVLFPTQNAVKTYVDSNITAVNANNTALQATVTANATATTAALALKEDAANKSTTTTLGTSNVLFPTQNAVKTYVDSNITTVNANNTALQATVTANATATTAALALKEDAANKSTITTLGTSNVLFPTQNAVKTYVDSNISTVNANNTALQATVTANATATTAALALKEDAANKSTTTTLGTSNVLFPTQNAVKTYVDSQVASATIPDANATTKGKIKLTGDLGGTADAPTVPALVNKENTINAGTTSQYYRGDKTWQTLDKTAVGLANVDNTTDATKPISAATQTALALKEDAINKSTTTTLGTSNVLFPTQNAVKTYVDSNITIVNANNTVLQATVVANATATTAALALKEDAANKSTTTTLGTSDSLFPTQNAVKTYVDSNITTVNANNTALQSTVVANATATTAALALKEDAINKSTTTTLGTSDLLFPTQNAVKTYVDSNITSVNANNTALQSTVVANATATTAALALKEDAANKSTTTTLGTSDLLFPTQNAVKTYVDSNITSVNANNTALQATVAANATATTAALALKEDAINKSTTTTLGTSDLLFPTQNAVKTYVDSNITSVNANNTALQATVAANATATTAALALKEDAINKSTTTTLGTSNILFPTQNAVKTYVDTNNTALQSIVTSNATATTAALALKEDAANKSTTTTLGTSDLLFPTQNAVKTYVDSNITTVNANNTALQATVTANATVATNAIAAVQADVNQNESDGDAADVILQNNITTLQNTVTSNATATTAALGLKEDAINKSTDVTLADVSNTKFPTELAVKTFVTNRIANGTAANVSGIVGIANGGTGSVTQNFVDLTTNQNISGVKTFSSDAAGTNVPDINLIVSKTSGSMTGTNNFLSVETVINPFVYSSQGIIIRKDDGAKRGFKLGQEGSNDGDSVFKIASFSDSADFNRFVIRRDNGNIGIGNSSPTEKLEVTGNLKTSGTITAGAITIPNTDGTPNQVLTTNGSGTLAWATPSNSASSLTGTLAVANGGTGSSVQNFVDLTNNQNIAGGKYFANNISANEVSIGSPGTGSQNTMLGAASFGYASPGSNNTGLGFFTLASLNGGNDNTAVGTNAIRQGGTANGSRNTAVGSVALSNGSGPNDNTALGYATLAGGISGSSNTAVGSLALQNNTTASYNVGVGFETLRSTTTGGSNTAVGRGAMYSNTSGDVNTAVGEYALVSNTNGRYNTSVGVQAQEQNTTGQSNTAIGVAAIDRNTAGNYNAVLGAFAGRYIADNSTFNTAIDNSVLIGALARPLGNNANNEIVIGYNAIGKGSNTIQLGNNAITNVNTSGSITANAEISSEITANLTINNANAEQYKAKVLICNPTSPITITFGNDLPLGFNCMVLQKSADANKINLAGGAGVTIKNRSNFTATAGNYAMATIVNIGGGIIVTAGDMQ
jgi:hypothetical protein